jgi:hypothetical protein
LRATDLIRFVPDSMNGTKATFDYFAWDQTGSTAGHEFQTVDATVRGGTSPFSTASARAEIEVTDVNDAPVITSGHQVATIIEPGDLASFTRQVRTIQAMASWS